MRGGGGVGVEERTTEGEEEEDGIASVGECGELIILAERRGKERRGIWNGIWNLILQEGF